MRRTAPIFPRFLTHFLLGFLFTAADFTPLPPISPAPAETSWVLPCEFRRLGDLQNTPASQLKFVSEAMSQISECRRILKWTYAFGFYSMVDEDAKKRFFEYTQGEAEMHLERLSEAVEGEKELQRFFQGTAPAGEFNDFRGRMAGLTAVTRKFFFTLVTARRDHTAHNPETK